MSTANTSSAHSDPFLYDAEQLKSIADEAVIRQALAWFKENRVHDLGGDEENLQAMVEDEDSDLDMSCHLSYADSGELLVDCDCGEAGVDQACVHAVSTLYAYAEQSEQSELLGAVESAIDLRVKRGRTEVEVEHLSGEPWFGSWKAKSINPSLAFPRSYRVNIRSLQRRGNYCDCQDFAINQLGTCKHIEAVLHTVSKRKDFAELEQQPAPLPYIYLSWEVENPPQLMLHRSPGAGAEMAALLDDHFSASGQFKRRLPDDFFRFAEQLRDRDDIHIGEDALAYAQQLGAQASQQVQARQISEQIKSSGGHLPGVKARLYPYQVEGVAFLAANGRALLADDMGLGKTLQSISAANWLINNAGVERVLIVCPASLKQQWAREIAKFTDHHVQIIQGKPEGRSVQYRQGKGFFIINYELILRDLSLINEILRPDLLILDEAQRIKNWRTKIATTIKQIPSRYAFVLSGTPLENRLEDLFSLMQVVNSNVLGPLWRYMVDFHITDERGKVLGYRNLSELRRRLAPVMLRRDRRLVSDQLPKRIEQRLDVKLTDIQRGLHDDAMANAGRLAHIAKKRPLTPSEQHRMMAALQSARMACNAAGLVDKETKGAPKLDEMVNIIDELCVQSGLKAVIFSQWEQMTQMVEERLKIMGVGSVRLHGGVPTHKRGELMDQFREDDATQVFISTDAGGVGLNLQNASVLINLDIPWNPAILDQRIARVHRLGQKQPVQVVLIVSEDSYEEHVAGLVKGKRHLFDNVIDPDATEDVVGVSKKMLETLVEDLAGAEPESRPAEAAAGEAGLDVPDHEPVVEGAAAESKKASLEDLQLEEDIREAIIAVQQGFGARIDRIMGAGGGLLVVLDYVDADDDQLAGEISSDKVPLALIDLRTLNSLQRLGEASPVKASETYYEAGDDLQQAAVEEEAKLLKLAREKIDAAEILQEQGCNSIAADLLISALLHAATHLAAQDQPPAAQEAGIWVYAEALPNGWLDQEQANMVTRSVAMTQAPSIPEPVMQNLMQDIREFVENAA